jgi:hypothetical protein
MWACHGTRLPSVLLCSLTCLRIHNTHPSPAYLRSFSHLSRRASRVQQTPAPRASASQLSTIKPSSLSGLVPNDLEKPSVCSIQILGYQDRVFFYFYCTPTGRQLKLHLPIRPSSPVSAWLFQASSQQASPPLQYPGSTFLIPCTLLPRYWPTSLLGPRTSDGDNHLSFPFDFTLLHFWV